MYKRVKVEGHLFLVLLLCATVAAFICLVMLVTLEYQDEPSYTDAQPIEYQKLTDTEKQAYIEEIKIREAWRAGLNQVVSVSDAKEDKVKGSSRFTACFLDDEACVAKSRAYRDEFNKVSFYFAPDSYTRQINQANFYLSLEDEEMPQVLMRFSYVDDSWLYIEGAVVIADGEVVLDKNFPAPHLRREILDTGSVYEFADVVMNGDLAAIEKMATADSISVLLRGEGGNKAYLDAVSLGDIKPQAQQILTMYLLLNTSLENALNAVKVVEEPLPVVADEPAQTVDAIEGDSDPSILILPSTDTTREAVDAVATPVAPAPVAEESNATTPAPVSP